MPNVVNIIVRSTDLTKSGFDGATKGFNSLKAGIVGAAAAAGTAMVELGVKSVEMASNFDFEMEKLHTQAGVAQNQIAGLSSGVLDLAGQVGQKPDSLAQALFHVESNFASLGITSSKALELTKIAAEGASVGGADLVDVTNALTAAVASGIPGVQDFSKAMGILNATVGAGDMTMQDLANALSTGVLAVVKGYGLSITDVSAALATFGDNNIRGQKAATDLRMAVQALAVPAKDGVAILQKWGYQANTLATDMQQHGLLYALEHLQQMFKAAGVSAQQQGDIITQMFGKRAGSGLAILLGQMDRLQSKYPDLAKGANGFADAWASTNGTLKQQWADIKAQFDALMIRMGEKLTPLIEKLIPMIKHGWQDIVVTFRELNNVFHFEVMFQKVKEAWDQLYERFKKDWPQIRPLAILAAFAVGLFAQGVLGLVWALLKFDTVAVGAWVEVSKAVQFFTKEALISLRFFADAAAATFGWIPGIGPELKKAAHTVDVFVDQVNKTLSKLINPTVTVTIVAQTSGSLAGQALAALSGSSGRAGNSQRAGYAQGGPVGALSAGGVFGGLAMVGERGAELVRLPSGSHVIPNGSVGGALAAMGGGGGAVRIESVLSVQPGADTAAAVFIMSLLRSGKLVIKQRYVTA